MSTPELGPCALCGGKLHLASTEGDAEWCVECCTSDCDGILIFRPTREEAIAAANRRPAAPPVANPSGVAAPILPAPFCSRIRAWVGLTARDEQEANDLSLLLSSLALDAYNAGMAAAHPPEGGTPPREDVETAIRRGAALRDYANNPTARVLPLVPVKVAPIGKRQAHGFRHHMDGKVDYQWEDDEYPASPRGERLRTQRVAAGVGLRDAGRAFNMTPVELSGLERGTYTLTDEQWETVLAWRWPEAETKVAP